MIERMAVEAEWPLGGELEAKYADLSHVPRAVTLGEGADEWQGPGRVPSARQK